MKEFIKQYKSQLLAVTSICGVVVTSVLVAKETPAVLQILEEAKQENEELSTQDKVMIYAKGYAPAIISGVITISCIAGSAILSYKQQASLISAYEALQGYMGRYRASVRDLYGEDAEKEIIANMARQDPEQHFIDLDSPDQKCIFHEPFTGINIVMYERELMDAEYHLNRNYILGGEISLNHFLSMLGLDEEERFDNIGWCAESGIYWIDFFHKKMGTEPDGTPIYKICYTFPPEIMYDE